MRLASLARKIGITPSQITAYLEDKEIALPQGSNTKLTDEQIESVLTRFDKELPKAEEEVVVEEVPVKAADPTPKEEEPVEEIKEEIVPEEIPIAKVSETVIEEEEIEEPAPEPEVAIIDPSYLSKRDSEDEEELGITEKAALDENVKVIKPPKVKLQGLTVKGKIDLPEPKPKKEESKEKPKEEEPLDPNKILYTSGPKRERRKPKGRREKRRDPNYNPIEAERKRKEREEAKEKEHRLKEQKKAREAHYKKKVQMQGATGKVKSETKPKQAIAKNRKQQEKPKNIFSKFWRWMNT